MDLRGKNATRNQRTLGGKGGERVVMWVTVTVFKTASHETCIYPKNSNESGVMIDVGVDTGLKVLHTTRYVDDRDRNDAEVVDAGGREIWTWD